jgi:Ca2+-binding RTX toxin-like protein
MYGGGGDDWLYGNRGYADGGPGDDHIQTSGSGGGNVTLHGGTGADQFQMEFEIQDGHARHVTISDFNQADGDLLYMGTIANLPDGLYFGDQAATFAAFDTNHDGQITGLQADGSGDLYSREVGGNLTMSNWEDSLTINGTNHVDFSMLLGA